MSEKLKALAEYRKKRLAHNLQNSPVVDGNLALALEPADSLQVERVINFAIEPVINIDAHRIHVKVPKEELVQIRRTFQFASIVPEFRAADLIGHSMKYKGYAVDRTIYEQPVTKDALLAQLKEGNPWQPRIEERKNGFIAAQLLPSNPKILSFPKSKVTDDRLSAVESDQSLNLFSSNFEVEMIGVETDIDELIEDLDQVSLPEMIDISKYLEGESLGTEALADPVEYQETEEDRKQREQFILKPAT